MEVVAKHPAQLGEVHLPGEAFMPGEDETKKVSAEASGEVSADQHTGIEKPSGDEAKDVLVDKNALGFGKGQKAAARLLEAQERELAAERVPHDLTAASAELPAQPRELALEGTVETDGQWGVLHVYSVIRRAA
jgi:hypothetical protein